MLAIPTSPAGAPLPRPCHLSGSLNWINYDGKSSGIWSRRTLKENLFFLPPPPRPPIKTVDVLGGRLPHHDLPNELYQVGAEDHPPPIVLL